MSMIIDVAQGRGEHGQAVGEQDGPKPDDGIPLFIQMHYHWLSIPETRKFPNNATELTGLGIQLKIRELFGGCGISRKVADDCASIRYCSGFQDVLKADIF